MKASELFDPNNGELKHKVRTVKDLIRFIETKENKDVSNYSIFLGAGASKSSGVSTAYELIELWMRELYERYNGKSLQIDHNENNMTYNDLFNFFEKEHASWFDASNAYSSLFEKKFDLAPQRRRFVEKEVDGKLPSIGYAYLVSLVEQNFFNAIFTTNFDDLLNEAFYQLSSTRPIVCAHDSSVHSISVSSKRPKIIKLHGDYLFENIKSTLRETESLEINTKDKLIEFCKEYGLIVVGYSGSDRSIMDVLDYLIKNDNYLRNGVYWCLRAQDEISPTLKNLFWKERIYPVIIDGFDEFFAEAHNHLLPNVRLLNNYRESKQQKIIQGVLNSKNAYNNQYIEKDIEYIEFESERQEFSYSLTEELDISDSIHKLKNTKKIIEIDRLISNNIEEGYEMAKSVLNEERSDSIKNYIIRKLVNLSLMLKKESDYERWISLLLEQDPFNLEFYKIKFNHIYPVSKRYNLAIEIRDTFIKNYRYHNYITTLSLEMFDSCTSKDRSYVLDTINNSINESLRLNPSLDNFAWRNSINIKYKEYSICADVKNKEEIKKKAYSVVEKANSINDQCIQFLDLEVTFANMFDCKTKAIDVIDRLFGYYGKCNKNDKYETLSMLNRLFVNTGIDIPVDKKIKFFNDYVKIEDSVPLAAILTKIEYVYLNKGNITNLSKILESIIKRYDFIENLDRVAKLAKEINPDLLNKMSDFIESKSANIKPDCYHEFLTIIYSEKGDYNRAISELNKMYEFQNIDGEYFSKKSYLFLKAELYEELYTLKQEYDNSKVNFEDDYDVLIINLMFANKVIGNGKFDKNVLRQLSNKNKRDTVKIAARLLVESTRMQALSNITDKIKKDCRNYFVFDDWVILTKDEKDLIKESISVNDEMKCAI